MSQYFLDTSALAKRYIPEVGSKWLNSWISPQANNEIIISSLATVEMLSILMRREREGSITGLQRESMQNDFQANVQDAYLIVDLDDEVLARARDLIKAYPLRTLDALQLASALEAAAEGLPTDDPNTHP